MNEFDFDLEDGEIIQIVYEPVDEDERGNIEFEIYAYDEHGKDIWDDITARDQTKIEKKVKANWKESCKDSAYEAAITRWEISRDF